MSYHLRLGESALVFFPPQTRDGHDLEESYVVQVMVKIESETRSPTREDVATYFDAQDEITAAIESILIENIIMPLQRTIEIEGEGYVLVGEKKDWLYGRRLHLKWGDEDVRACADKWVFYFRTCKVAE
ncbi:hypothetical protein C8F04DRAFT_1396903 [Mycena alexandri]|uniref:Uncharacterized protein n=1 Tax=Mycena alexandri TaxID=1745969 RepID=A0AAD6SSY2_9AGAR|nr:hypothetical protein C8F04DRAFT_1396903 [Mycena alexandri]